MAADARKRRGAYYTPDDAVAALVRWAVRRPTDKMLDPSCGDGRFLALHPNSVGVERHELSAADAGQRAPHATIFNQDFFVWAAGTDERFDCAVGNPPFIRYHHFAGDARESALRYCARLGVRFSALTSSWAPFLVAAASLLKPGGRLAFVVPAEIGHAPYARPLLEYLLGSFERTQFVPVKEKIFPDLSEDVWLLYAHGFGRPGTGFRLSPVDRFEFTSGPPSGATKIPEARWREWDGRLRPFLLRTDALDWYRSVAAQPKTVRLGDVARVSIGYVTGANDFFHLRPSTARRLGIPAELLHEAVRNGRALNGSALTSAHVRSWLAADEPVLLLKLGAGQPLPAAVEKYLASEGGGLAQQTYKCRNREPWYVVPDVYVPDAFLTYMSSREPALVANKARCVGTNSVHTVRLRPGRRLPALERLWDTPLRKLSCELEGHPLGGGLLKIEPREAARIVLGEPSVRTPFRVRDVQEAIETLQAWRHCDAKGKA